MPDLIHLSGPQRAALTEALSQFDDRPSEAEYAAIEKKLRAIPAPKPKQSMKIPHTLPGFTESSGGPRPCSNP